MSTEAHIIYSSDKHTEDQKTYLETTIVSYIMTITNPQRWM
jgi:hypothetical protein